MKKLPPLPKSVHSLLGPVPVAIVEDVRSDGVVNGDTLGNVNYVTRKIQLRSDLSPAAAHCVLKHEWVHITLWDAGVKLDHDLEERICDVIATALVAEMQNR